MYVKLYFYKILILKKRSIKNLLSLFYAITNKEIF